MNRTIPELKFRLFFDYGTINQLEVNVKTTAQDGTGYVAPHVGAPSIPDWAAKQQSFILSYYYTSRTGSFCSEHDPYGDNPDRWPHGQ